jgi:hypothetical protein
MQVSVSLLDAGTVTAFMVEYCPDRNTNSVSMAKLKSPLVARKSPHHLAGVRLVQGRSPRLCLAWRMRCDSPEVMTWG